MTPAAAMTARPAAAPTPAAVPRWRSDLLRVALATLGCWWLAGAVELRELVAGFTERWETWQADELPFAFVVLAAGLAWYALRRRRETQAELQARAAAEAQAQALLAHNRELARRLITLQEDERRALARELHDELGQACTALRVETALVRRCAADDAAAARAAAERADAAALGLYDGVRALLRRLRPAQLDALGLPAALRELCEGWAERSGTACVLSTEGDVATLPDALNVALFRVAQEALTNVMRHAGAGAVRVVLARCGPDEVMLSVADDGRGFDPAAETQGLGLLGAAERAAALGGTLLVRGRPGDGATLVLRLPLSTEAA